MKILLVYPEFPDTFWSFKHALKFISKKATHPPLGLLTIASMLPEEWNKKLIDLNVRPLRDTDFAGIDFVFLSAMSVQSKSVISVIKRCKEHKIRIVAGGPFFTAGYIDHNEIDYLVLNEAEITLPQFLNDLETGNPKHIYSTAEFADLNSTPIPSWNLIRLKDYSSMSVQFSRGCPYNCDFCDVTNLFGRKFRTKSTSKIIEELNALYKRGWRGNVFFVDDNFIGNKKKLKLEVLPEIIEWQKAMKYPFTFNTQASINLSDDDELLQLMVDAGFNAVFVGIETTNEESLKECKKTQNQRREILHNVKKIQKAGMEVQAGFILGFDNDPPNIFDRMVDFIQQSGIVTAMVGLLNAPKGTKLYERLVNENRIVKNFSGNNTDVSTNLIPKLGLDKLIDGYKRVVSEIYSPKYYYERVKKFLKEFKPQYKVNFSISNYLKNSEYLAALMKSIVIIGIKSKARIYFWKLFFWSLFKKPKSFPLMITFSIYGYHFQRVFENLSNLHH
ncbi:MAG: B12-binding domain-containing radical SAM protein [Ignavibacteria bacterium]